MTACFHCGLPVPSGTHWQITIGGENKPLCCPGCQAVAQAIIDCGMASYYQHRDTVTPGTSPAPGLVPEFLAQLSQWDDASLQQAYTREDVDGSKAITLLIEGITCAACAWLIEHRLSRELGVIRVRIDLTSHRAELQWDPQRTSLSTIFKAIAAVGYKAEPYTPHLQEAVIDRENKQALTRIGVAGLGAMQVMMFAVGLYAGAFQGIADDHERFLRGVSALVCLPVYLYAGWPFLTGAWRNLKARQVGMDVPVAIAITAAYLSSLWSTYTGGPEVYFDSVCMFIFFLLVGRYVEMRARHQALASAIHLSNSGILMARIVDGAETRHKPADQLAVGDRVLIKPGEVIPGDGRVIAGHSAVNEAMLSGEDLPVSKGVGDLVTGGTLNTDQPLEVEITQRYQHSVLYTLRSLLDRAQCEKPKATQLAQRTARFFVARVLLIAPIVYAVWYWIDPSQAFWITLSVLVVTCPCALSLATPTALTAATHRLARRGLLPTNSDFIEACQGITDVVFDKTGTLTEGYFTVTDTRTLADIDADQAIALACALETPSEHPIARAFHRLALQHGQAGSVAQFHSVSNQGVSGELNGHHYRLGVATFACPDLQLSAPTALGHWLLLSRDDTPIAWIQITDRLREDAATLVDALHQRGLTTHILSGDHSDQPAWLGQQLHIPDVISGATPDQKVAYLRSLQAQGRQVLMLGDGLNDAPVLAGANVSIAMADGTDLAKVAADAVLLNPRISTLLDVLDTAATTFRVMRQNTRWAIGYNLTALPAAALGLVPPWLAALGMSASSLVVVLNALRIRAKVPTDTASQNPYLVNRPTCESP